jgi:hypothetical protein
VVNEIDESAVDIPEPEEALPAKTAETSLVDPGGDPLPTPSDPPRLGEDPAYDPGGMGRQPDVVEDEETYNAD